MHNPAAVILSLFLSGAGTVTSPPASFTTHVITLPDAAFANVFVIETEDHVTLVDAGFSAAHAQRINAVVDSIGKPVRAILLTHGHVDHYGGLHALDRGDAPVMAGVGVARQIEEWDEIYYQRLGVKPPSGSRLPEVLLGHDDTLDIDGVQFILKQTGPGESYADTWWFISAGEKNAAIIGDLAMYGLPPFVQSGHSADWIATLERLKREIPEGTAIYLGHDIGGMESPDPRHDRSILDWQIARLRAFRTAVADITGRRRLLTDEEVTRVVERLREDAPENLAAFDLLVATTANVLAAELILERQREQLEAQLRRLNLGERP